MDRDEAANGSGSNNDLRDEDLRNGTGVMHVQVSGRA
jgi:hypothetical protein